MSGRMPHEGDDRDSEQLLAELEEEITSWLEQGGMNLMTVLNGQSVSDEATARDTIWDLVQQDGFGGTEPAGPSSELLDRWDLDSDIRWSDLVASYIDSLSCSLLPRSSEEGSPMSFRLDEGHAGGCG
ncbi:hypothetical protein ACFYY3_04475 [Streptomyces sp. NPDC001812]|uniref:hypothetical protein n=1 Tax=Streptomyces sp. NPDC001812 TaxID=3364611 RepID=UPI0036B0D549